MNILEKVKRLKELSAKATPGPWTKSGTDIIKITGYKESDYLLICTHSMCPDSEENVELNVKSRNAIDELCLCVEELSEALKNAYDVVPCENARALLEKWIGK